MKKYYGIRLILFLGLIIVSLCLIPKLSVKAVTNYYYDKYTVVNTSKIQYGASPYTRSGKLQLSGYSDVTLTAGKITGVGAPITRFYSDNEIIYQEISTNSWTQWTPYDDNFPLDMWEGRNATIENIQSMGSIVTSNIEAADGTYPVNASQGGFWYVRKGTVTASPPSTATISLTGVTTTPAVVRVGKDGMILKGTVKDTTIGNSVSVYYYFTSPSNTGETTHRLIQSFVSGGTDNLFGLNIGSQSYLKTDFKSLQPFLGTVNPDKSYNCKLWVAVVNNVGGVELFSQNITCFLNEVPSITITDPNKRLYASSTSPIIISGVVQDLDIGNVMTLSTTICGKVHTLIITSTGGIQNFQFIIKPSDLIQGIYPLPFNIRVTDDFGDFKDATYTGGLTIDKTLPFIITSLPIENNSDSPTKFIGQISVGDSMTGIAIDSLTMNGEKSKRILSTTNIQTLPNGYYVLVENTYLEDLNYFPNTANTVYVKNTTETNVSLDYTVTDRVGNILQSTVSSSLIAKHLINSVDLGFINYNEELPTTNARREDVVNTTQYNTTILNSKPLSTQVNIKSYLLKNCSLDISFNGVYVYTEKLSSPNLINELVTLDLDVKNSNEMICILKNENGIVEKMFYYYIFIEDKMPLEIVYASDVSVTRNEFNKKDIYPNSSTFIANSEYYYFSGVNSSLYMNKSGTVIAPPESKILSSLSTLVSTGVCKIEYSTADRELVSLKYNLVNSKPSIDLVQMENNVGFNLNIFGTILTNKNKSLSNLITKYDYYIMEKTALTEQYFKDTTNLIENIKQNSTKVSGSPSTGLVLPRSGEYLVCMEIGLLNYKEVVGTKLVNYMSQGDKSSLINVEGSNRFMYNSSLIYDTVTNRTISHNSGLNTQAKVLNGKIFLYGDKLKVYTEELSIECNSPLVCKSVELYDSKIYLALPVFVATYEDTRPVGFVGIKADLIKEVEGNLLISSGNKLYNLTSDTGVTNSLVNMKIIDGITKIIDIYNVEEEILILDSLGKVISIS